MNYKGHIIFGIIFLIIIFYLDITYTHLLFEKIDLKLFLLTIPILFMSFVLPDIDHRMSMPRLIVTIGLILIAIYYSLQHQYELIIIFLIILLIIWILPFLRGWGHRGHMHSIIFIFLISLLVILISWKIAIVFFIGAFTHLLADRCIKLW